MLEFDQKISLFVNSFIRFCEQDREKYENVALKRTTPEPDQKFEGMINFLEYGALAGDVTTLAASGIPIPLGSIIALPLKSGINVVGKFFAARTAAINSKIMSFDQNNDYVLRLVLHEAIREITIAFEYHLHHLNGKRDVLLLASTASKRLMNFLSQQKNDFILDVEGVVKGVLNGSSAGGRISSDIDDALMANAWTSEQLFDRYKWDSNSIFSKSAVIKKDGKYYKNSASKSEKYGYRKELLPEIDDLYTEDQPSAAIYGNHKPHFVDVGFDKLVEYAKKHRDQSSNEAKGSFNEYIQTQIGSLHSIIARCKEGPKPGISDEDLDLSQLDLRDSDFTNINLEVDGGRSVNLQGSNLEKTVFIRANLKNVNLENAICKNAIFVFSNFEQAKLADADFTSADLTGANLSGIQTIASCILLKAKLGGLIYNVRDLESVFIDENIGRTISKALERIQKHEKDYSTIIGNLDAHEQKVDELTKEVQQLKEDSSMMKRNLQRIDPLVPEYYPGDSFLHIEQGILQNSRIIISGIAGSGKTQAARYYAQQYASQYTDAVVLEIKADSQSKLEESYKEIVKQIYRNKMGQKSAGEIFSLLLQYLEEKANYLLIFDNVDTNDVKIKVNNEILSILQATGGSAQHKIIVTSQDSRITMSGGFINVMINGWAHEEAMLFILNNGITNHHEAEQIAQEFECLPLGIYTAVHYIKTAKIDVLEYFKRLSHENQHVQEMLHGKEEELISLYYDKAKGQRTQNAAISLAIKEAVSESYGRPEALELLSLSSFISADKIPFLLLVDCINKIFGQDFTITKMNVEEDLTKLQEFSLITGITGIGNSRMIDLHRIVQKVTLSLISEEQKQRTLDILLEKINKYFVKDTRFRSNEANLFDNIVLENEQIKSSYDLNRLFLPHVEQLVATIDNQKLELSFTNSRLNLVKIFNVLGYFYTQTGGGHIRDSEKYLSRAKLELEKLINLPDTEVQNVELVYERFQELAAQNEGVLTDFYPKLEVSGKISQEIFKQYYLAELYVSILYSLGRTYFYDKETYRPRIEDFKRYIRIAHGLSNVIEQKARDIDGKGIKILHKYLSESEGLLYFNKEDESNIELIASTRARYIELAEDPESYYEDGRLKKQPGAAYDKIRCYKQIISCSSLLNELDIALEYFSKLEEVLHQPGQKAERLAVTYNEIGYLFLKLTEKSSLGEAEVYFLKAYSEEKTKSKKDYPLFDACIGLAKVKLKSGQINEAREYFEEARSIAAVIYQNGHQKLTDLQEIFEHVDISSASTAIVSEQLDKSVDVYFVKEQVYDNLLLQHSTLLTSVYEYGGIKALNQLIELGKEKDIAAQILEEIEDQGVEAVLSTLFVKQEESKNQEAAIQASIDDSSNSLLLMIDKVKEAIGENEANSLWGFSQYVMNALGHNPLTTSAQRMIKAMSDSIENLEYLLDASMYEEDEVLPYDSYITAVWLQLENLFKYIESGQRMMFYPRPPYFDPDDFDGGFGGGYSSGNENDNEIDPYIEGIVPIYNNTNIVFIGENSTSLEHSIVK